MQVAACNEISADFILSGNVEDFYKKTVTKTILATGDEVSKDYAFMYLSYRLIDVATKQISFSNTIKTEVERQLAQESAEDYDVFMAIAEKLGKDRRGNPIYLRDEDGAELLFDTETQYVVHKKDGTSEVKTRREKLKQLDDDLPKITEAYFDFLNGVL